MRKARLSDEMPRAGSSRLNKVVRMSEDDGDVCECFLGQEPLQAVG